MKHACGAVPLLQCSLLRRAALSFDAAKVLLMLVTFLYLSSAHLSPVCIEVKDFTFVTDMHPHACYMLFDWDMKSHLGPC